MKRYLRRLRRARPLRARR